MVYYVNNELYHHGIKGQKWGMRRYQNSDGTLTEAGKKRYDIDEARSKYKEAKKTYKTAVRNNMPNVGFVASRSDKRKIDAYLTKNEKLERDMIDAKAALAKAKRGDKAELNSYARSMRKLGGLPGSISDDNNRNKSSKLYDHLARQKGKEYAEKVEKKLRTQVLTDLAVSSVVFVGSTIAAAYLENN